MQEKKLSTSPRSLSACGGPDGDLRMDDGISRGGLLQDDKAKGKQTQKADG